MKPVVTLSFGGAVLLAMITLCPSQAFAQVPARFPDDAGYPPLFYKKQFVPPPALIKK